MRVVITGGAGFLGQLLARRLLSDGKLDLGTGRSEPVDQVILADLQPPSDGRLGSDDRVKVILGGISSTALRDAIASVDGELAVFHLASMVSAGCEADFDGALAVNLDGTRDILEACRARESRARLVFSSSIVAYGGMSPTEIASDRTKLVPETTYGATKAMCELLVNDYTRKGFVDGRSARLPTVVIRPGRPNAAASGWVSSIFREPLKGEPAIVPVDEDLSIPVTGYRTVVDNLLRLCGVAEDRLGNDRAINLPSVDASPRTMRRALEAASDRPLGRVDVRPDPEIQRFFAGWAHHASFDRATDLGLEADVNLESIVREYIDDSLPPVSHG